MTGFVRSFIRSRLSLTCRACRWACRRAAWRGRGGRRRWSAARRRPRGPRRSCWVPSCAPDAAGSSPQSYPSGRTDAQHCTSTDYVHTGCARLTCNVVVPLESWWSKHWQTVCAGRPATLEPSPGRRSLRGGLWGCGVVGLWGCLVVGVGGPPLSAGRCSTVCAGRPATLEPSPGRRSLRGGVVGLWGCGVVGLWGCGVVGLWGCGDGGPPLSAGRCSTVCAGRHATLEPSPGRRSLGSSRGQTSRAYSPQSGSGHSRPPCCSAWRWTRGSTKNNRYRKKLFNWKKFLIPTCYKSQSIDNCRLELQTQQGFEYQKFHKWHGGLNGL